MKLGAVDFIAKPFEVDALEFVIQRALEQARFRSEHRYLREREENPPRTGGLLGDSAPLRSLRELIGRVAPAKSAVLITGETGTGKELVARAIHWASRRRDKRFLTINCGALPVDLLESELFGHEKGAFTGAIRMKIGKFEYGDGGTIFLDEVGEIPPVIQVKILRVLQEREFERVGGNQPIKVDVRIIAATNKDLHQAIEKGEFREDLYYRLNVVPLRLPPLRARREDIPILARHFLTKCREKFRKEVGTISQEALNRMLLYSWPGNVRELENLVERAVIMARGNIIQSVDLPHERAPREPERSEGTLLSKALYDLPLEEAGEIFERSY
ncbi:MAG: sigma-54 dependent transcriptional regulator, partial [Vicinamibacteria bacterium]